MAQEVLNYKILHKYDTMIEQLMVNDKDKLKGLFYDIQFILFNFANQPPSIAMELKVSNEITCK